jgi:hypothetical protein
MDGAADKRLMVAAHSTRADSMRWLLLCLASASIASTVHAQRDPAFEAGLSVVGGSDPSGPAQVPGYERNKVVKRDARTSKIVGASLALGGGVTLVAAWATYVARQSYRLRPREGLTANDVDSWATQGAWSFWLGLGAASALVGSEYLLLPEAKEVPMLAWLGGLAGLVTGAVGVGYLVGGTHCAPLALRPGAVVPQACSSGTADDVFGLLLLLTSAPLVNIPLTYLLRSAFAPEPEPLTFSVGPGSLSVRGRF